MEASQTLETIRLVHYIIINVTIIPLILVSSSIVVFFCQVSLVGQCILNISVCLLKKNSKDLLQATMNLLTMLSLFDLIRLYSLFGTLDVPIAHKVPLLYSLCLTLLSKIVLTSLQDNVYFMDLLGIFLIPVLGVFIILFRGHGEYTNILLCWVILVYASIGLYYVLVSKKICLSGVTCTTILIFNTLCLTVIQYTKDYQHIAYIKGIEIAPMITIILYRALIQELEEE